MQSLARLEEIKSELSKASQIVILVGENPTQDNLGSALALFLALSSVSKKINIVCSTPPTVEFTNLFGINKVSRELPGKNFVISLDYSEGSIEKVSYNIAQDKFNLVIEPKAGAPLFTPEKVHYSQSGVAADLIFTFGIKNTSQLNDFFGKDKDSYSKVAIINVDNSRENNNYGKINLVSPNASSISEIVVSLFANLGLQLNQDMATNFLSGISFATNNFSKENISPDAYEAMAICLRAGGKRKMMEQKNPTENVMPGENEEAPADWLSQPKIFKSNQTPKSNPQSGESTLI